MARKHKYELAKNLFLVVGLSIGATAVGVALRDGSSNKAEVTITPNMGLSNGEAVIVTGSHLAVNAEGAIMECNTDSSQPKVFLVGEDIPVSCSNPLSHIVSTDANGNLSATTFRIVRGRVGPPATESSGSLVQKEAAQYPCPPTATQIAAGDTCQIEFFDDASSHKFVQNITFATKSN